MPLQQLIAHVGTSAGPSWTVHNDEVWLAWKGEGSDTGIYVISTTSLRPDATSGQYTFNDPQQKVLTLKTSSRPAITSLLGTLYLFWRNDGDDYIYWATSSDGKTWANPNRLALGESLGGDNDQHPKTGAPPTVVAGDGALYLFWKDASDNKIWYSGYNGGAWTQQISITTPNGTPETAVSPAVVIAGQTLHLVFKGKSDNSIWWSTYSTPLNSGVAGATGGPWSAQSKIFSGAAAAPALVCDGNSVVWLAWTAANGGISFASLNRGSHWSAPADRAGIASSDGPALLSTGNDSQEIVMAWKGEGTDPGIYYGSLTGPLPPNSGIRELLVIAPTAFMADVNPLITHKNKTGMPAIAASIEDIISFFPGVDEPEQIKQAIRWAREKLGTQYVMLVGDASHFPVRFWFSHGPIGPPFTYKDGAYIPIDPIGCFIQSDLYYANLYHHVGVYPILADVVFDNWDSSGNGLYNEACIDSTYTPPNNPAGSLSTAYNPDNVDGFPDVAVGRVPARNNSDVRNYVNKVITYETRVAPLDLAFTFVADQPYDDFGATTSMAGILSGRNVSLVYLMIENSGSPQSPFLNATPHQVAAQAATSAWLSYLGHGSQTAWGQGSVFTSTDVALTKESSGLPVVFAAGCGTALFMPNVPWDGYSGQVTSIDINGVTRGPFEVDPHAVPGEPGLVVTDTATNLKWGINTQGCKPLPVRTPRPAPMNVSNDCCAHYWLFDSYPGGAIVYIGDHCVSNDSYPAEIQTHLLNAYVAAQGKTAVLGGLYLIAQQQYWAGPHSNDATTSGLSDYHGIPRLYLGWMVFFGDPSLRIPLIPA